MELSLTKIIAKGDKIKTLILMGISFALAIGTAIMNEFNPFSLLLIGVTGIGFGYQLLTQRKD